MPRPVKILLVEDDAGDARLLRSTLADSRPRHHEIQHVTTLGEATSRLVRYPLPDIVLLDLSLADSTGQATLDGLFRDNRQIPVVVLTGLDDDAAATAAMEAGAQDYVVKGSVTGEVLARAIRHAIERHQLQSALGERVKEQAGLFAISQTLQRHVPLSQRCAEIADHLTHAMQFPAVCHATVTIDATSERVGPEAATDVPVLTAPITVDGTHRGQVVVGYSEPDLGFYMPEEATLLESAADAVGGWLARQDALHRLVRDEERLRIMVSQLPGLVWTTDRDLRVTSAVGAALAVLDIDPEELEGRPLPAPLGAGSEQAAVTFQTALAGNSAEFEGSWQGRWWRHRVEPKRTDLNGEIVGTVCLTLDITTERQQQSELDVAHQRFRGLFTETQDAMLLADDDGVYVDANPAACTLLGYSHDELLGMNVADLTPDDHEVTPDVAVAMWRQFLDGGVMAGDFPVRRKDGATVETEFRAVANIAPGVHLSTLRDITDRKRATEALANSEARFRNIAESSRDVIYQLRLTPELGVDYISPALKSVTGFEPQDLYDNPAMYLDRLLPETGDPAQVATTLDALPDFDTFKFQHAAGHWIWLEYHHTVMTENGEPVGVLGVLRDVTTREQTEQALRDALHAEQQAADRLRAVDEIKSNFLQAVSHELRTPLTSVLGYAHTLKSGRHTPEQGDDFHRRLLVSAERLDALLGDLLDVDRLNKGIVRLNLQETDLAGLAADIATEIELADRTLIIDPTPAVAQVDAPKVERIIHNLIANAVKHTLAGATIWVSFSTTDTSITITVSDNGPGVPELDREHVFEPFWQAPAVGSMASPGTGIGLALVRQLATLHGGRTWVGPREGGGASFHVDLPVQPPNRSSNPRGVVFRTTGPDDTGLTRFRELMDDTMGQLHTTRHPDEVTGLLLTWIQQVGGYATPSDPDNPDVLDIDLSLGTPQPLRAAAPPGSTARKRLDNHLPFLLTTAHRMIDRHSGALPITTDDIDLGFPR